MRAAPTVWVALPYVLAGLTAWSRSPESRLGPLMVAAGFAMFLSSLCAANDAVPYTIGMAFDLLPAVLYLHVFPAIPSGRLDRSLESFGKARRRRSKPRRPRPPRSRARSQPALWLPRSRRTCRSRRSSIVLGIVLFEENLRGSPALLGVSIMALVLAFAGLVLSRSEGRAHAPLTPTPTEGAA